MTQCTWYSTCNGVQIANRWYGHHVRERKKGYCSRNEQRNVATIATSHCTTEENNWNENKNRPPNACGNANIHIECIDSMIDSNDQYSVNGRQRWNTAKKKSQHKITADRRVLYWKSSRQCLPYISWHFQYKYVVFLMVRLFSCSHCMPHTHTHVACVKAIIHTTCSIHW